MTELKTRATTASVAEFLAHLTDERRSDCDAVMRMMETATGEHAEMWGASIVGFGRYAYTNSSRKTMEWPIIGFSPRKNDLTLYITPGFEGFTELMGKLGKHKHGKSCLYLKRLADVDAGILQQVMDGSVQAMEAQRIRR